MAASVPLKKDTKPRDKEGDKKSEVVRYPRLPQKSQGRGDVESCVGWGR